MTAPQCEGTVGASSTATVAPSSRLADLRASVHAFASARPDKRSGEQLGADLVELRHLCDLLEMQFALDAAAFARANQFDEDAELSPYAWIKHHCKMGAKASWSAICVGEMAQQTPLTLSSLQAGRVGFGHVAELAGVVRAVTVDAVERAAMSDAAHADVDMTSSGITDASTGPFTDPPMSPLPATPAVDAPVFDEAPLLRLAEQHTVSRFRHDCAHARHAGDPEGFLEEHLDKVASRTLQLSDGSGGLMTLKGTFDSVGGAAIRSALEPLARRNGSDDDRLAGRRLADALVELAQHGLDVGLVPQRRSQRPHLQVTTTLETLLALRGAPAAELEFSAPIAAETVARFACDATITRVLLDADSAVIDVGRAARGLPSGTRRALNVRDGGCIWTGCDRSASWTQAHHIEHWTHGGRTDLANLALLCHRHHWLVHEGGWQMMLVDGQVRTIPPPPRVGFTSQGEHSWARGPDEANAA